MQLQTSKYFEAARAVVLRAATPEDAAGIAAIHCLPGYRYNTLRLPFEKAESMRKRLQENAPGAVSLVATVDDMIVGDGILLPFEGRRRHAAMVGMGVHDDYVGCGIGKAMMGALVSTAEDWLNVVRLELTVYSDNTAAIGLYKSFGFIEEGLHRKYAFRDGAYVDALAMARVKD